MLPVDAIVSDMASESVNNAVDINKSDSQVPDKGDNSKVRVAESRIASLDDAPDKKSLVLPAYARSYLSS